jgi:hypothetical protein
MACGGGFATIVGMVAMGGMSAGGGFGNMGNQLSGSLAGIDGPASAFAQASQTGITFANDAAASLSSSGLNSMLSGGAADFLGNGSILGSVGESFGSTLSSGSFFDTLGAHTAEIFGGSPIKMVQAISSSDAFSSISSQIAPNLDFALGAEFGSSISALQNILPTNEIGSFLGESIGDFQGIVTNGFSYLEDFGSGAMDLIGADLTAMGDLFNVNDLPNFGNAGQIIGNIIKKGGEDLTGIRAALAAQGVDINQVVGLASSTFNADFSNVLGYIDSAENIGNIAKVLDFTGDTSGFTSARDFTKFDKVMQQSAGNVRFDSFEAFADSLQRIELGQIATPKQLGQLVKTITTVDLPTIFNSTSPMDGNALAQLTNDFLGGTGPNGSITLTDMIGSVGGVGITENANAYKTAMKALNATGKLAPITAVVNKYNGLFAGTYTSEEGDPLRYTDPDTGVAHETMDSFVSAVSGQVDTAMYALNSSASADSVLSSGLSTIKGLYNNMQKKVSDEKTFQAKTDLQLSLRNNNKENSFYFMQSLDNFSIDPTKAPLIEGMIQAGIDSGDKYSEYMRLAHTENINNEVMQPLGIRWRSTNLAT